MDLPKASNYGISCIVCDLLFFNASQEKIELMVDKSFQDAGMPLMETPMGIVIGFGRFPHLCRPLL